MARRCTCALDVEVSVRHIQRQGWEADASERKVSDGSANLCCGPHMHACEDSCCAPGSYICMQTACMHIVHQDFTSADHCMHLLDACVRTCIHACMHTVHQDFCMPPACMSMGMCVNAFPRAYLLACVLACMFLLLHCGHAIAGACRRSCMMLGHCHAEDDAHNIHALSTKISAFMQRMHDANWKPRTCPDFWNINGLHPRSLLCAGVSWVDTLHPGHPTYGQWIKAVPRTALLCWCVQSHSEGTLKIVSPRLCYLVQISGCSSAQLARGDACHTECWPLCCNFTVLLQPCRRAPIWAVADAGSAACPNRCTYMARARVSWEISDLVTQCRHGQRFLVKTAHIHHVLLHNGRQRVGRATSSTGIPKLGPPAECRILTLCD
eukprot:365562-Chlamydomonas_euryale.AAC.9